MDPLHAVYLTVGLFVITFFNPGANLFVVVQTSLASGRRAGAWRWAMHFIPGWVCLVLQR